MLADVWPNPAIVGSDGEWVGRVEEVCSSGVGIHFEIPPHTEGMTPANEIGGV